MALEIQDIIANLDAFVAALLGTEPSPQDRIIVAAVLRALAEEQEQKAGVRRGNSPPHAPPTA